MRHRVAGRKLGRTTAHRVALLRNLSTALFERERITTTLMKAKELRPFAERLVTLAKRETLHARRQVLRHIHDRRVVAKLFDTLSARYAQRPGGYTRIVKLGPRRGDHAEMALVELVDAEVAGQKAAAKPAAGRKGKAKPKAEAAAAEAEAGGDEKTTKKTKKKKVAKKKTAKTPAKKAAKTAGKKTAKKKAGKKTAKKAAVSKSSKKTKSAKG